MINRALAVKWLRLCVNAVVFTPLLATAACRTADGLPAAGVPLVDAATARSAGRVETVSLPSTSLGTSKDFKVYLPAGYPNGGPYPVLYLFRGTMDEWLNPQQDDSRHGRNAVSIYEGLAKQGSIGGMILVFVGLGSDDGRWPGILTDWAAPNLASGVGNGKFASYFLQDVIPAVDQRYRTVASAKGRAVDGFSLGGWAAVQAAALQPDSFVSVGAYDGTFPIATAKDQVSPDDGVIRADFLDPVFGKPRRNAAVLAASPVNRIWQGNGAAWQHLQWLVEYGPESAEPDDANYYRGEGLNKVLQLQGIKDRLGVRPDGHHNWWTADEHLRTTLPLHWAAFQGTKR